MTEDALEIRLDSYLVVSVTTSNEQKLKIHSHVIGPEGELVPHDSETGQLEPNDLRRRIAKSLLDFQNSLRRQRFGKAA